MKHYAYSNHAERQFKVREEVLLKLQQSVVNRPNPKLPWKYFGLFYKELVKQRIVLDFLRLPRYIWFFTFLSVSHLPTTTIQCLVNYLLHRNCTLQLVFFTRQVWHEVLAWLRMTARPPDGEPSLFDWWQRAKQDTPAPLRKGLASATLLVPWMTWKHRNSCVFDGAQPSMHLQSLCFRMQSRHMWGLLHILRKKPVCRHHLIQLVHYCFFFNLYTR